jgi:hypothetical protein
MCFFDTLLKQTFDADFHSPVSILFLINVVNSSVLFSCIVNFVSLLFSPLFLVN